RRKPAMTDGKLEERNIPGMNSRASRFAEVEHAQNAAGTLKRLLVWFSREKALVLAMLLAVLLGTIFGIAGPSLQSCAIDIIAGSETGVLTEVLLLMAAVWSAYCFCQMLQGRISGKLSQRIVRRMRDALFEKIMDLPVRYLDTHSHGDVMSRMTNDIENISTTVSQSLPSLFSGVLTIAGTVAVMIWYCWQMAVLSCVTVLMTVIATRFLSGKVRHFSRRRQQLLGQLNGAVEEMISSYRTVVAYQQQEQIVKEFSDTSDLLTKAGIRTDVFSGVMGPVMNCIGNIGFVIIAAFGGYFAVTGRISVGVISAFIVYARQFSRPVNELAQIYGQLQTAVAGAERVFAVLDEADEEMIGEIAELGEETTKETDRKENIRQAEVSFCGVNFSYVPGRPVLRDFTLTIPPGKKVALVGATGSGKTTVANLLMRFYEPDSGEIRINGKNIREMPRCSLRKMEAIVLQDTVLFSETIRNNLKFAKDNATDEELDRALKMSCCARMIQSLPDGPDTRLTASGANLSQGQQQLLAIARAFVTDPQILILDEATSSVDTRTEKTIQHAMQQIMQNRTGILIAHRLSTIRDADLIVVMDQGQIAEVGTHEELLAAKGTYYELYMTQYAGFST
ncbi:MAG: ABC transporter ATP-binding protein, partial [Anaerovoracaceae bacterium]